MKVLPNTRIGADKEKVLARVWYRFMSSDSALGCAGFICPVGQCEVCALSTRNSLIEWAKQGEGNEKD